MILPTKIPGTADGAASSHAASASRSVLVAIANVCSGPAARFGGTDPGAGSAGIGGTRALGRGHSLGTGPFWIQLRTASGAQADGAAGGALCPTPRTTSRRPRGERASTQAA